MGQIMSKEYVFDENEEEDGWYSEPHLNHVTQTKKESIISEVLADSYYFNSDTYNKDVDCNKKKGYLNVLFPSYFDFSYGCLYYIGVGILCLKKRIMKSK